MDDFGSGYSSLNMLRNISLDAIKLDAQFLRFSIGEERRGVNILESVISMTKSLATPVIVEGVETRELVRFLKDMGCRYIQGFYYYQPMPKESFRISRSLGARIFITSSRSV
jgi:EAL domain-containing protein (putative c-di-GMP-specific phosphodiesterase class I)